MLTKQFGIGVGDESIGDVGHADLFGDMVMSIPNVLDPDEVWIHPTYVEKWTQKVVQEVEKMKAEGFTPQYESPETLDGKTTTLWEQEGGTLLVSIGFPGWGRVSMPVPKGSWHKR